MAHDDKNKTDGENEEAPEKKKRSLVGLLLALLVVVSNGALVLVLLGGGSATADQPTEGEDTEARTEPGVIVSLDPFVINLDEPGQPRYLRVGIGIEVTSEDAIAEVDARMTIVRDRFISVLSSQQADALRTAEDKDRLRGQLLQLARDVVSSQAVLGIYFTEFLIQ